MNLPEAAGINVATLIPGIRMRRLLNGLVLAASLVLCGCAIRQPPPPGAVAAPAGMTSGPACRVYDEDMFGRRYCRVRYVYGSGS